MKLFKSLLVAPATLGLLAPMSATASEVNLSEIANYSDIESIEFANSFDNDYPSVNPLLAGGEGLVDDHSHDGSFSETTTAEFSANFYIGSHADDDNEAATANDLDDAVTAGYDFGISLTTSFTGDDSLAIDLQAGEGSGSAGVVEFGGDDTNDSLDVDGLAYTFPLGDKTTVMVADNADGSSLFTTACVYGGPSDTLDDCGAPSANFANGGAMVGASYDFGQGLTAAAGYAGSEASLMTEEGVDAWGLNVAYTGDNYGVSASYAKVEVDTPGAPVDTGTEDSFLAVQGYYVFEEVNLPSISVGYEVGEDGSAAADVDGLTSYFVGLTWQEGVIGPGSAGIAMGTKVATVEDQDDENMYEAYYAYPLNDGVTITPLVFMKEESETGTDDETGIMVKTSFTF